MVLLKQFNASFFEVVSDFPIAWREDKRDVIDMEITDYLGKTFQCDCGRSHSVAIDTVEISDNALEKVADIIRDDGFGRPFIISDSNTHKVAGNRLLSLLSKEKIPFSFYMFEETELVPDELALGKLLINYDPACDVIIGVGSGTISDLSRFFSHYLQLPYYIVATAPSMDGYASTGSALIRNNLKTTFDCQMPRAIIADISVISSAPQNMIAAGFCDVVGKYTSLADWRLSAIINDEYYCKQVAEITRTSLEQTIALKNGIAQGDPQAIGKLMEALILAGISMSFVGNSRPASGSEHHLSHFWEMRFLFENKPAILHGTKVGIATILIAGLYQRLREEGLAETRVSQIEYPNCESWVTDIKSAYQDAASEIVALEKRSQKNSLEGWQKRIKTIQQRWTAIQEVLQTVPSSNEIEEIISAAGGVVEPGDAGLSPELVREALLFAKEVRPRYTILQLLWDLNLLSVYTLEV